MTVGIAHFGFLNALNLLEIVLCSPETTTRKIDFLQRVKLLQVGTIARFLHLFFGHEAQGSTVDAIALAAFLARSVVEDVSQMRITKLASHFSTRHAMRPINVHRKQVLIYRPRKSRPTAPRIIFIGRDEEGLSRGDVHVNARSELVIVGIGKGPFGGSMLCHVILFLRKHRAKPRIIGPHIAVGVVDFHRLYFVFRFSLSVAMTGKEEQREH